jgi:hypothetical protein
MPFPELIQTLFLIVTSLVGWALKKTLEDHLKPIKEDMKQLRVAVEKMTDIVHDHKKDNHPHDVFEERLNNRFVTKEQLSIALMMKDYREE